MTPLQMHLDNWKDCQLCQYSQTRKKIVLGRGDIPCDILMIGEAPGPSENMLGVPFIGKAGKILDRIVNKVFGPEQHRKYKIAYNNVIACIPLVEGHEKEEPDTECIMACKPRIEEFVSVAQSRLIIAVGKLSEDWLDQRHRDSIQVNGVPVVTIQHPASILRMPVAGQHLAEHRCGVIITTAVIDHLENK